MNHLGTAAVQVIHACVVCVCVCVCVRVCVHVCECVYVCVHVCVGCDLLSSQCATMGRQLRK